VENTTIPIHDANRPPKKSTDEYPNLNNVATVAEFFHILVIVPPKAKIVVRVGKPDTSQKFADHQNPNDARSVKSLITQKTNPVISS
jgi:hypothetical protein